MSMYVFTVVVGAAISFVAGLAIGTKFGPAVWQKISSMKDNLPNVG